LTFTWLIAKPYGAAPIIVAAHNLNKSTDRQGKPRTVSLGTSIAEYARVKKAAVSNHKEVSMFKNFALLSIGAALLFSPLLLGTGHAFQIDLKKQTMMKTMPHTQTAQVSKTSMPCRGRDATACKMYSKRESMARY